MKIICKNSKKADLFLVRTLITQYELYYSEDFLEYLKKHGELCDISLVIKLLNSLETGASLLSNTIDNEKNTRIAKVLYKIGKNDLYNLLKSKIPGHILAIVVSVIPDNTFKSFSTDNIFEFLKTEHDEVRKMVSIKFGRVHNTSCVKNLLEKYINKEDCYYNVIHWLDYCIYNPKSKLSKTIYKV